MCQKKIMRKRSSENLSVEPPKKRISPGGNVLPPQIPLGEILTDLTGKQWKIGKTIGYGGFGEIYVASDNITDPVKTDAQYVIKVESHSNGPLFVEVNCMLRIARLNMIEEWKRNHKITNLGVPHYIASGSFTVNNEKLRFIVIPRYEKDLEKIFLAREKKFNLKTVILICTQILDALEYIHSKGYVHCDIKATNIMCKAQNENSNQNQNIVHNHVHVQRRVMTKRSCRIVRDRSPTFTEKRYNNLRKKRQINYFENVSSDDSKVEEDGDKNYKDDADYEDDVDCEDEEDSEDECRLIKKTDLRKGSLQNQKSKSEVVLIDYGLATKYLQPDGGHKQYCNDERKAHAGTVLFCSIDAHLGATSRRSDLETLGYNIVYWLTSSLPWENDVSSPETVQSKKETCLNNLETFLKHSFKDCPSFISEYFRYVKSLTFEAKPDYAYCKNLFLTALTEYGYKNDSLFDFDCEEGWGQKPKKIKQRSFENRNMRKAVKSNRPPLTSNILIETLGAKPMLRKKTGKKGLKPLNWSKILADPECIMRGLRSPDINSKARERKITETSDTSCSGNNSLHTIMDILRLNPTYAMLDVFNKSKDKNGNYNGTDKYGFHKNGRGDSLELEHKEGYTPAMDLILTKMHQRRLKELEEQEQLELENKVRKPQTRSYKANNLKKQVKSSSGISKEISKRKIGRPVRVLRGHRLRG